MGELIVCCLKQGKKYGPQYVRVLKSMVERNLTLDHEFVCFSDDMSVPGYRELPTDLPGWWGKVGLFKPGLFPKDAVILYLDLDVVIVENLDDVLDCPTDFAIIRDWNVPGYNSSAMLWTSGARENIYTTFKDDVMQMLHGDQDWINRVCPNEVVFPEGWFTSYRKSCVVRPKGKVVVFHGDPKPSDFPSMWIEKYWRESAQDAA